EGEARWHNDRWSSSNYSFARTRRGCGFVATRNNRKAMMSPVTYVIEGPWTGQLAIVPRPRGGDWLADELRGLKNGGFDTVLSLLTPEEAKDLGISDEPDATAKSGMQFFN